MRRYDVDHRDLRLHARARLGAVPERPRGRERPVRDELGIRQRADDRRPARVLQVHGQVDRREARPARDLHAEAVREPHRQRLPRACLAVAQEGKNLFDDPKGELGLSPLGLPLHRRRDAFGRALAAITNPTVNSYKRINAPPTLSGATWSPNTVTYAGNNRTHMIRIPGRRPLRAAPRRRRGQSVSAAGRAARRRARRHPQQARSGQAARHQHVHARATRSRARSGCRSTCSMRCARSRNPTCCARGSARTWRSRTSSSSTTTGTPIRAT